MQEIVPRWGGGAERGAGREERPEGNVTSKLY